MQFQSLVVILMGSRADLPHAEKIAVAAARFGLAVEMRISSAHKTPEHAFEILKEYEADPRPKVYITTAGRSNALSGFTDGVVSAPVIACPPVSESFGEVDIFSSLRMPSGIAPAVVLDTANAALLAAKILGLIDPKVLQAVKEFKQEQVEKVLASDQEIQGVHGRR